MATKSKVLDFPVIIKAKKSINWKYESLACMNNVSLNFITENQSETVTWCDIKTFADRAAELTATLYSVMNPTALELFQQASNSVTASGAKAININVTVPSDWIIELPERSSDNLWVTAIVVKDSAWATITLSWNYTVALANNVTTITINPAWVIDVWDVINITWTVNVPETNNSTITLWAVVENDIDVMLEGWKKINGVYKYYTLEIKSGSLTSWYALTFLNSLRAAAPAWSELTLKFNEQDVVIMDQVTPAEV